MRVAFGDVNCNGRDNAVNARLVGRRRRPVAYAEIVQRQRRRVRSLLDTAARVVQRHSLPYSPATLPADVIHMLANGPTCWCGTLCGVDDILPNAVAVPLSFDPERFDVICYMASCGVLCCIDHFGPYFQLPLQQVYQV